MKKASKKKGFGIKRPGALTAKAKAAGMSLRAYAEAHKGDKGLTGEQSRYYLNVILRGGRKSHPIKKKATSRKRRRK